MNTLSVDPLVCLSRRESPEDGAPACGAWLSEHCPDCGLCPGVHADDCTSAPQDSDTVCPRCGVRYPWHSTDCALPRSVDCDNPERTEK